VNNRASPVATGRVRRLPTGRAFRRSLWVIIGGVIVFGGVLLAVNLLNGPRLTAFSVDEAAVVADSNSRLVLSSNQQLGDVSVEQITVLPESPVSVQTTGVAIIVSFDNPLNYNTDYSVSVRGITGTSNDRASQFDVDFRTGEPPLYYLNRDSETPDRILRTRIGSPETAAVFSASRISEFVTLQDNLIVVTPDADGNSVLSRVDANGQAVPLTVPGRGTITDLEALTTENLVGFRFDSAADVPGRPHQDSLFILDLSTGVAYPVVGLSGEPLHITQWGFVGGGTDVVAELSDATVMVLDARTNVTGEAAPVRLGAFSRLTALAADGSRIAVSGPDGQFLLDLSTGSQQSISGTVAGTAVGADELRFLAGAKGFVRLTTEMDPDTVGIKQRISLVEGGASRIVYEPASQTEDIVGFSVSPNNQYLAVRIVPNRDEQTPDGYSENGQARETTTLFVNVETGQIRRSVVGFDALW